MGPEWRTLARGLNADINGEDVVVRFENGRFHRVRVHETEEAFEVRAVVAGAASVRGIDDLAIRIWRHNRAAQLVSFRIDTRGRVCAQGWVPKAGVTTEEFQLVLRRVAVESDRLEFLLTGKDSE